MEENEEKKNKPKSIVLEVQNLRHEFSVKLRNKKREAKDGEKHT